jgi:hypothetical protein
MKVIISLIRLIVGILAGLIGGISVLVASTGILLLWQILYYSLFYSGMGISPVGGDNEVAVILFPALVVYVLPLTDGILCPGILTGATAHRLRSIRQLVFLGCLTGAFFFLTVWRTYEIFDPVLLFGFMTLEIITALAVCGVDTVLMRFLGRKVGRETGTGTNSINKRLIICFALFAVAIPLIGWNFFCTFPKRDAVFEEQIETFVRANVPGSEMRLFNGNDLGGWEAYGFGDWSVKNGIVTVRRSMGYLCTRCNLFSDLILEADVKVNKRGNSGIRFRATHPGRSRPLTVGYEVQVDHHDSKNPTGSLYNYVTASPVVSQDGEWFNMRISAIGERIQVHVNGTMVVDTTNADYKQGFINLQGHDPFSVVSFKNVRVKIPE